MYGVPQSESEEQLPYAPYFMHNLTTQYINETQTLIYDVNCSDFNPGDELFYYDNATEFEIDIDTGIINWTPIDADVGNHTIEIMCYDGELNVTGNLKIVVIDVNNPPILDVVGNRIAVEP